MRCSALQCIAVFCSVLQCIAVYCSVLQCIAVYCSVLQCFDDADCPLLSFSRRVCVCECVYVMLIVCVHVCVPFWAKEPWCLIENPIPYHIHICICKYVYICIYLYIYIYIFIYIYIYVYIYIYFYIYICIYIYTYVYIYVYIYICIHTCITCCARDNTVTNGSCHTHDFILPFLESYYTRAKYKSNQNRNLQTRISLQKFN